MVGNALDFLANETIGIIGCGHLGRTLAKELIDHGFPKEQLMVSYGGRASTLETIKRAGLLENIAENEMICRKSTIIFITVRPQAVEELKILSFPKKARVVSCMAGVSSASLKNALGIEIFRIMPSGPDTIKERKGIIAVYPHNDALTNIMTCMGMKVYELQDEEMMHIFTVGVCLPAALLLAKELGLNTDMAANIIGKEYADFEEIYTWAKGVLPGFDTSEERDEYIRRMSTKGGITEAIVDSLSSGNTFLTALQSGIARSKHLSAAGFVSKHN